MACDGADHPSQCSQPLLPQKDSEGTGNGRACSWPCWCLLLHKTGLIAPPWRAGEEGAEDSDEEINEELDIDAAADAFAAAARQKGFGDGPQPGGEHALPVMLLSLSPGCRVLPECSLSQGIMQLLLAWPL